MFYIFLFISDLLIYFKYLRVVVSLQYFWRYFNKMILSDIIRLKRIRVRIIHFK